MRRHKRLWSDALCENSEAQTTKKTSTLCCDYIAVEDVCDDAHRGRYIEYKKRATHGAHVWFMVSLINVTLF